MSCPTPKRVGTAFSLRFEVRSPLILPHNDFLNHVLADLNQTAYPDRNYKNNLMDEVRKWKWMAQNAMELSVSLPNNSTPNTSTIQDTSIVSKMKSYMDERPDLEAFISNNAKFFERAASYSTKIGEINERLDTFCDDRDKLVLEISNDVRDDILLDC